MIETELKPSRMSNRRFLSQPRQTLMVNNVPVCSSDPNEEIKLNEQVVARLKSRASRARKFRKRKSKVVPLNEYFEELNSEHKNSEEEIKSKPNKEVDDVKNYEIFPKRRLQEKIDRFLSPYNKTYNFRKCMNFEEGVDANIINQVDPVQSTQPNHKWNKISDFILNQKGDFLRKSLRCINKDLYRNCEEMSKSMIKITPRRSNCKDQAFYRFQSIRSTLSSSNKRLSYAKKKSGASYLKIPTIVETNKPTKEEIEEEEDQIDEENISKALCIMKVIKQTKRSSSIESKTSSETELSEEEEEVPNDFDQFLNELKSNKKKIARNINKSTRRMNTDMIKYNIRVQSYEPVSKSNQSNENLLREKPNLRIFAERRLNKCTSETFRSEKNIFKSSPLLSSHLWMTPSKTKDDIVQKSSKYLDRPHFTNTELKSEKKQFSSPEPYKYQTCKNILDECDKRFDIDPKYVLEKSEVSTFRHQNPINFSSRKLPNLPCFMSTKSLIPNINFSKKSSLKQEVNTICESAKLSETTATSKVLSSLNSPKGFADIYSSRQSKLCFKATKKVVKCQRKCIALDDIIFIKHKN